MKKLIIFILVFVISSLYVQALSCPVTGGTTYPCPASLGVVAPLLSATGDAMIISPDSLVTQTGSLTLPSGEIFTGSAKYFASLNRLQIYKGILNGVQMTNAEYTNSMLLYGIVFANAREARINSAHTIVKTPAGFSGITGTGFTITTPQLVQVSTPGLFFYVSLTDVTFMSESSRTGFFINTPQVDISVKKMMPGGSISFDLNGTISVNRTNALLTFRDHPSKTILLKTFDENTTNGTALGYAVINPFFNSVTCDSCEMEIECGSKLIYKAYEKSTVTITPESCNINGTGEVIVISDNFDISGTMLENGQFNYKSGSSQNSHLIEGLNTFLEMIPHSESLFEGPDGIIKHAGGLADKKVNRYVQKNPFIALGFEETPFGTTLPSGNMNMFPVNDPLRLRDASRLSSRKKAAELSPAETYGQDAKGLSHPNKLHFSWKNQDLRMGVNPNDDSDSVMKAKSRSILEAPMATYRLSGNKFESFVRVQPLKGTVTLTTIMNVGKNGNLGLELNDRAVSLSGHAEFDSFTIGGFGEYYHGPGRNINLFGGGLNYETQAKGLVGVWARW